MDNILLPPAPGRPLSFYLAMEEYVAAAIGCGFFVWSVDPTVIIGRNQVLEAEVNVPFCREHGIEVVRRKSGGGCVYADRGNLMISYITPERGVEAVFAAYLEKLSAFLRRLGLPAVFSAHNDILVEGRKVSGNAFFVHPKASIVHGTLLVDVDFDILQQAITPPAEKLGKHGVASVRQRVANLSEFGLALGTDEISQLLTAEFCTGERLLPPSGLAEIGELQQSYFILGKAP